ncbi:hypothetical protein Salat_2713900 [Sesamum alatum]|uniref:Pentatricopeptide repeat-containing protein n=1 Tax=Sesamum alatum TaxID=300844 RepID=A0AAE1XQ89_9LAMI|nr:hypothetical protein Salat_2713900 [Sesamum alatum]
MGEVGSHSSWLWTPIERKCLSLLQMRTHSRATLLQIHAFMLRHALEGNLNLITKLITALSSVDQYSGIRHARRVFDKMPRRSEVFLCNTMMKSHLLSRQFSEAIGLQDAGTVLLLLAFCRLKSKAKSGIRLYTSVYKWIPRCWITSTNKPLQITVLSSSQNIHHGSRYYFQDERGHQLHGNGLPRTWVLSPVMGALLRQVLTNEWQSTCRGEKSFHRIEEEECES